jgi:acyl carrier protein
MRDKIIAVVKKYSKDGTVPDDNESLFDAGYLDSFALPDVVSDLEQEFGIKIPDSDLNPRKFESIARIESYLEGRK